MAGIQALVNQKTGERQGNPNPIYYSLAASEYGASGDSSCNSTLGNTVGNSCIFYDVTLGDIDIRLLSYSPSNTLTATGQTEPESSPTRSNRRFTYHRPDEQLLSGRLRQHDRMGFRNRNRHYQCRQPGE